MASTVAELKVGSDPTTTMGSPAKFISHNRIHVPQFSSVRSPLDTSGRLCRDGGTSGVQLLKHGLWPLGDEMEVGDETMEVSVLLSSLRCTDACDRGGGVNDMETPSKFNDVRHLAVGDCQEHTSFHTMLNSSS